MNGPRVIWIGTAKGRKINQHCSNSAIVHAGQKCIACAAFVIETAQHAGTGLTSDKRYKVFKFKKKKKKKFNEEKKNVKKPWHILARNLTF